MQRTGFVRWASVWLAVLGVHLGASAAEVYFRASADTTLMESYPLNNLGGEWYFNTGTIQNNACLPPFPACRNRALLKFDVAGNVPPGARITAAYMLMDMLKVPPNDETDPNLFHGFYRLLTDWGEGTNRNSPLFPSGGPGGPALPGQANWTHRFAGTTNVWAIPGGAPGIDFRTNASMNVYLADLFFTPYTVSQTPELVEDVQFWLDSPAQNFGWLMKPEDETRRWTAKRLMSRENPINIYPLLFVTYFFRPEVTAGAPVLSRQTGLFVQTVSVRNTNDSALEAARVLVGGLPAGTRVFNASGSTNGVPFVQYNRALAPGETVTLTIEYYATNRVAPVATLTGDLASASLPMDVPGTAQPILRREPLADGSYLIDFATLAGRHYYVQYSPDMIQWQSASPAVVGTGSTVQWVDNGPPKTDPAPQSVSSRFYRVLLAD